MLSKKDCQEWKDLGYPQVWEFWESVDSADPVKKLREPLEGGPWYPVQPTIQGLLDFLHEKLPEIEFCGVIGTWAYKIRLWKYKWNQSREPLPPFNPFPTLDFSQ